MTRPELIEAVDTMRMSEADKALLKKQIREGNPSAAFVVNAWVKVGRSRARLAAEGRL